MPYSIRVINYWGDMDDVHDLILIGNYPTSAARTADLNRLASLPDVYGSARLVPSSLDAQSKGLDGKATPEQVADVGDLEDLVKVLYNLPDLP